MCGIAGYIGKKKITSQSISYLSKAMHNRGPDNFSYSYIKIKKDLNLYLTSQYFFFTTFKSLFI